MIITISLYKKYFGSHDRKKSIHEISMKLWQTDFLQKNAKRVMFFCGNIAAGDDGVSFKFFCLIKSYMVAIWLSEELQRSTIIFFWWIIRKNLRAHAIDFYWRMLSNSKWSWNWTIMHLFHESFNKIWICARKEVAKMNHENSFFSWISAAKHFDV